MMELRLSSSSLLIRSLLIRIELLFDEILGVTIREDVDGKLHPENNDELCHQFLRGFNPNGFDRDDEGGVIVRLFLH
jgi:hypothetical protein